MNKWMKPFSFLVLMILICSLASRMLTRGETLLEYADNNPEMAYAAPDQTKSPQPSPSDMPKASPLPAGTSSPSPYPAQQTPVPSAAPVLPALEDASDTIHYADGFFYQPLTDDVVARITGISYPVPETIAPALSIQAVNTVSDNEKLAVSYDDLRYLSVLYYDFQGEVQTGELICNKGIAQDLAEIFHELYLNEYQIEKIRLIDNYKGDDTASMADNNTSCFNYRVVDGTDSLSKHALGCAIDINPFYNPYVVFNKGGSGETYISPAGSEIYADRSQDFPYKIDENDLCYKLFKQHGFTWGGNWNSCKDYQHFQKVVG